MSNNSVLGSGDGEGSGIYVVSVSGGSNANVALVNSTVAGNASSNGAAGIRSAGAEVTLSNTIVARQASEPDCVTVSTSQGSGVFTSLGHNLDSDGTCGLGAPGDRPNANANLGPLADNGGPTQTHELLEGSDAMDAGDDAVCAAEPVNGADQRDIARPQAQSCDIGSFEREFDPFPTALTVEPALLDIEGGLLGLRLRLLDLSARIVRADTRAPIEGETITMTVGRQRGGSQVVCSAVTDADGIATCSGELGSLLGLVLSGYTATFAGTWKYEPSSASAPLIRVDLGG